MEHHEHSCKSGECHLKSSSPSVHQTLDEMDFERGIWTAAMNGDLDRVQQLVAKDAHPDSTDNSGFTALHYAARNGHSSVCSYLLEHKANPNARTRVGGATPLHRASYCGHADVVSLLLRYNAIVDQCDDDEKTPLHKAAENGNMDVVCKLLTASKDPQKLKLMYDRRGKLAVDYATNSSLKNILS